MAQPRLGEAFAHSSPDPFLILLREIAVLDVQEHHVGPDLLRSKGRDTDGHLNELVEIARHQLFVGALEVPAYGVLNHGVVGRDNEGCVVEEQEQPDSLKSGDGGCR